MKHLKWKYEGIFLSLAFFVICFTINMTSIVLLRCLNPYRVSFRILSVRFLILISSTLANTLPGIEINAIARQFSGLNLSPFLEVRFIIILDQSLCLFFPTNEKYFMRHLDHFFFTSQNYFRYNDIDFRGFSLFHHFDSHSNVLPACISGRFLRYIQFEYYQKLCYHKRKRCSK